MIITSHHTYTDKKCVCREKKLDLQHIKRAPLLTNQKKGIQPLNLGRSIYGANEVRRRDKLGGGGENEVGKVSVAS